MTDLIARAIAAAAPYANVSAWASALAAPMQASGITTPRRIAMFIGQVTEETGDFRTLSEDLYYTTALHIRQTWPTHFADVSEAASFIGRPAALANHVYANRMGNGNEESGDGWRYRGRGLIQVTGKNLYQMLAKADPRATDPDWLLTPVGAAVSACWFWALPNMRPSLNALADAWDVAGVTERINGGTNGLPARQTACEAALGAISVTVAPPVPSQMSADELMNFYNTTTE